MMLVARKANSRRKDFRRIARDTIFPAHAVPTAHNGGHARI